MEKSLGWLQRITRGLAQRQASDNYRSRFPNTEGTGRIIRVNDRHYLNFSSNDYLGLSRDPSVIRAWQQGAERLGIGSGGSGHVTGYTSAHAELEQQLADWLGYPRALLFISGYTANQAIISTLLQDNDRIIADKLAHASLLEAAQQSPAELRRFQHNQPDSLRLRLQSPCVKETLVVTEGIFSMDGDSAPLSALQAVSQQAHAWFLVDDAHGIGVKGAEGRGSCYNQQVQPELLMITFGKAFGLSGAALLCSQAVAEYFIQFSRHLIYSTNMPAPQALAISAALQKVRSGEALRQRLQQHIAQFRAGMTASRFQLLDSDSAIQPIVVGENRAAMQLAQHLRERGIWVNAIRPPTVAQGSARVRITLSAAHCQEDIQRILEILNEG